MQRVATTFIALLLLASAADAQAPSHPLDGLSAREHWTVRDALVASGRTDSTTQYLYVGLNEPDKSEVLAWRVGQPFRREAFVHLIQSGQGFEAIVDINSRLVLSWSDSPGQRHSASPLLAADDYMLQRAGFTEHMLWITPYDRKQLYASGDYPTVHPAGEGLPAWTAGNRSITNQDLVAWVTMGFHHVPRPEDWPLMPVAKHSLEIRPVGFFSRNPSIDLPKP